MDKEAYLHRIGYRGPRALTWETLRHLQVAHLRAVPFENLDIHAREPISLGDDVLFEKIVTRRRGGFCYELNGLFAALLRGLGFDVHMLSARVARPDGTFGPDFDHMTLMVALGERWLADVGFGDSFLWPLRLDERGAQDGGEGRAYRIGSEKDRWTLWQRDEGGEWAAQYAFDLEPRRYVDYDGMCRFHQTSPESHFTRGRVCSLATPDGRITLSGMRLVETAGGERRETTLAGEDEWTALLQERFGVRMA